MNDQEYTKRPYELPQALYATCQAVGERLGWHVQSGLENFLCSPSGGIGMSLMTPDGKEMDEDTREFIRKIAKLKGAVLPI